MKQIVDVGDVNARVNGFESQNTREEKIVARNDFSRSIGSRKESVIFNHWLNFFEVQTWERNLNFKLNEYANDVIN